MQKNYNNNGTVFGFALIFVIGFALAANEFVLKPMGFDAIVEIKFIVLSIVN